MVNIALTTMYCGVFGVFLAFAALKGIEPIKHDPFAIQMIGLGGLVIGLFNGLCVGIVLARKSDYFGILSIILVVDMVLTWLAGYFGNFLISFGVAEACLWTGVIAMRITLPEPVEPGYCAKCSYNLTGNTSGVCPECGTPIQTNTASNDAAENVGR